MLKAGNVIVSHCRDCRTIEAIVCFGSVAMDTADDMSDLDLYVLCEPDVLSEQQRRDLLAGIPGASAVEIGVTSSASGNDWFVAQDRLRVDNLPCDIVYHTVAWLGNIVDHVLANDKAASPELPFRPYTLLGMLDSGMVLFDRDGVIKDILRRMRSYPAGLRTYLVNAGMTTLKGGLEELRNYQIRGIGNAAFAFQLNQMSEALCMVLYALNDVYDPATKRVEQRLKTLPKLPDNFMRRYEEILSLPLDDTGRQRVIQEYELMIRDLFELCQD